MPSDWASEAVAAIAAAIAATGRVVMWNQKRDEVAVHAAPYRVYVTGDGTVVISEPGDTRQYSAEWKVMPHAE